MVLGPRVKVINLIILPESSRNELEILPEDSFYVPVDNPEVSSTRHEYFAWNSQKGDRFRSGRRKVGR